MCENVRVISKNRYTCQFMTGCVMTLGATEKQGSFFWIKVLVTIEQDRQITLYEFMNSLYD